MLGFTDGPRPAAYSAAADTMLQVFLGDLEVRGKFLAPLVAGDAVATGRLQEIEARLAALRQAATNPPGEEAAWNEAHALESMMALVEPLENLPPLIALRLEEATAEGASAAARLKAAAAAAEARALDTSSNPAVVRASEETRLRGLLLEILHAIHWTKQRKFHGRPLLKSVTRRIVIAGLASFLLFVLPYLLVYVRALMTPVVDHTLFVGLPFYTALTAGLFGAYFSRLMFIQSHGNQLSLGELKTAREFSSIFLRGAVGMCGAVVVFFFLRSGVVEGSLFPQFADMGFRRVSVPFHDPAAGASATPDDSIRQVLPSQQLALLAIWCFLAGFSERLVPSILSSTEQRFDTASRGTRR
jgi:hypothetical protein